MTSDDDETQYLVGGNTTSEIEESNLPTAPDKHKKLTEAKKSKNDEFYTRFEDISSEIGFYVSYNPDVFRGKTVLLPCDDPERSNFTRFFVQNFELLGLKKLISTSYAPDSKNSNWQGARKDDGNVTYEPSDIEKNSPLFDCVRSKPCGKKYVLERDFSGNGAVDIFDLGWTHLDGDGDFRSEEVRKLRDEADIIVTNPPFSLYREFWDWLQEKDKQFLIISPKTAVTYKNVYPLIQANKVWSGARPWSGGMRFESKDPAKFDYIEKGVRIKGVAAMWLTNMEHSKRHEFVEFSTMNDNLTYGNHSDFNSKSGYMKYENYDAIEVPYYDSIPSDYDGVMGVPFTFLDKFCPEQFEIVGFRKGNDGKDLRVNGKFPYFRMLIRKKQNENDTNR